MAFSNGEILNRSYVSLISAGLIVAILSGCAGVPTNSQVSQSASTAPASKATPAEIADGKACKVWNEVALPSDRMADGLQVAKAVQSDLVNGTQAVRDAFQRLIDVANGGDLLKYLEEKGKLNNVCTAAAFIAKQ